jgi:hypothetical protein
MKAKSQEKRQGDWWSEKRLAATKALSETRRGNGNPNWCGGFEKAEYARQWRKRNEAHVRDREYQKRFGITLEEYDELLDKQHGLCAICKGTCKRGRLGVDHDHRTGKVRGLLCRKCNILLGLMDDDPQLMKNMEEYLRACS